MNRWCPWFSKWIQTCAEPSMFPKVAISFIRFAKDINNWFNPTINHHPSVNQPRMRITVLLEEWSMAISTCGSVGLDCLLMVQLDQLVTPFLPHLYKGLCRWLIHSFSIDSGPLNQDSSICHQTKRWVSVFYHHPRSTTTTRESNCGSHSSSTIHSTIINTTQSTRINWFTSASWSTIHWQSINTLDCNKLVQILNVRSGMMFELLDVWSIVPYIVNKTL